MSQGEAKERIASRATKGILEHYPETAAAAEAQYWAGVCRHQATHDPAHLGQTAQKFKERYQESVGQRKRPSGARERP